MKKLLLLTVSHLLFALAGFAVGIYALPILTAPKAPSSDEMANAINNAQFKGEFRRDLKGSDFLHWGEGVISIGDKFISLQGEVAPGPDYKLYLSPQFVETEEEFLKIKDKMVQVGNVKTFKNFIVSVPKSINPNSYNTAIVWCESFGEFISAASYK